MLGRRLASTFAVVIWLIFLFFLSIPIREDIAHTYYHHLPSTEYLSVLTTQFALPILGSNEVLNPEHSIRFYLFWGLIWVVPLTILVFSWRIKEPLILLEFLFYAWLSYLPAICVLFLLAAFGLVLPFLYL